MLRRILSAALALAAMPPPAAALAQSANNAITYTISSAGATCALSGCFSPVRSSLFDPPTTFHVQLSGTASATCYLERMLDGTTWTPITVTAGGSTTIMYNWTYSGSTLSEDISESQAGVLYRLDCGASLGSYTSGTLTVKFFQ
jgi:hypothetical protein